MKEFKNFTENEINVLEAAGCCAGNWSDVYYKGEFLPDRLRNVSFAGTVKLGDLSGEIEVPGAGMCHCGVYNARLVDVEIGDNCLIDNVGGFISKYRIGDRVLISDCGRIYMEGSSSFGNGVKVAVLDETGGREVPIFSGMSAQFAYMLAMYRHDAALTEALSGMAMEEAGKCASDVGVIDSDARVCGVKQMVNVRVGAHARLDGCTRLENGTVLSVAEKPTRVGAAVIAENFIIHTAATVSDAVNIENCFVGQGVILARGFSGTHSLFFANSHFENGEAVSIFAGPFTVSHHKATLLIGLMNSFYNAGSGTNFSNHLYKLGPMHQGVLERGVKCGSGSYMMHPVKVGAFSTVIGHHTVKMDTSDLPFSCILDVEGKTRILPGINLKNIGLYRDEDKWGKRDKRTGEVLDCVHTYVFTPLTAGKMLRGIKCLEEVLDGKSEFAEWIAPADARKGIALYRRALEYYIGLAVMEFAVLNSTSNDGAWVLPRVKTDAGGQWVDLSGMLAPKAEIESLMAAIAGGNLATADAVQAELLKLGKNYADYAWGWIYAHLEEVYNVNPEKITSDDLKQILNRWTKVAEDIIRDLEADAAKEFAPKATVSFGVDSLRDPDIVRADIEAVRGTLEASSASSLIAARRRLIDKFKECVE